MTDSETSKEFYSEFSASLDKILTDLQDKQVKKACVTAKSIAIKTDQYLVEHPELLRLTFVQENVSAEYRQILLYLNFLVLNRYSLSARSALVSGLIIALLLNKTELNNKNLNLVKHGCGRYFELSHQGAGNDLIQLFKALAHKSLIKHYRYLHLASWQWMALWAKQLCQVSISNWSSAICQLFEYSPTSTHGLLEAALIYPSLTITLETQTTEEDDNSEQPYQYPTVPGITRPPKALLKTLSALQRSNVDIDKLAEIIESTPSFSQFIQQTAQDQSRMGLAVTSVKQGVLTHGLERLSDMLVSQALSERFNHTEFPLRAKLFAQVHLCQQLMSELAFHTGFLLPQTASLLCLTAHSLLFTHRPLKTQHQWLINREDNTNNSSALCLLIDKSDKKQWLDTAIIVAKNWRFSPRLIKDLQLMISPSKGSHKLNYMFDLALLWSNQIFHGQCDNQNIHANEAELMTQLSVDHQEKMSLIFNVQSALICPLEKY